MPTVNIILDLSPSQCLSHYAGQTQWVQAYSTDGRLVEFPARALRRIVTREGAVGTFRLEFSEAGRFVSILRVGR